MISTVLRVFTFCFLFLVISMPQDAFANTGSAVGGPNVDAGKFTVEFRTAGSEDDSKSADKRLRTRVHIDYAFNEVYAARLVVSQDKRKTSNMEHAGVSLQNRFHLLKAKDYGFDGGIRLNYTYADGDKKPDVASLRFYQRIPHNKWEVRFNQIFEHEIGENADTGVILEWRSQVTYSLTEKVRFGIDVFNNFGNMEHQNGYTAQEHALGPVLKAKLGGGYSIETAYRIGISKGAPDQSATFTFSKTW